MKIFFRSCGWIFLVLLLIQCVEDPLPETTIYPLYKTSITDIDEEGVSFKAELVNPGTMTFDGYGFRWQKGVNSDNIPNAIGSFFKFDGMTEGGFSQRVTFNLIEGQSYSVQSFVIQNGEEVFYNTVTFVSQATSEIKITDYYPKSVIFGDTITVEGINFSTFPGEYSMILKHPTSNVKKETINTRFYDVTNESFRMFVPSTPTGVNNVELVYTTLGKSISVGDLEIKQPKISSVSHEVVGPGTKVTINGTFSAVEFYNRIFFGDIYAPALSASSNQLEVYCPDLGLTSGATILLKVRVGPSFSNIVNLEYQ